MQHTPFQTQINPRRSHNQSNQFQYSQNHSHHEGFQRSHRKENHKQHQYIIVCLTLEKYLISFMQKCRKLMCKNKRQAFRCILQYSHEVTRPRQSKNGSTINYSNKMIREKQDVKELSYNPEQIGQQLTNISGRNCELVLQKMINTLQKVKIKHIVTSFAQIKALSQVVALDLNPNANKSNLYDAQLTGKSASRMSNKRKKTKNQEDYKQNSHLSTVELSNQNQRMRVQLMHQEQQRENFFQQFSDLLEHHQKYLSQGSSTTRTKKNK